MNLDEKLREYEMRESMLKAFNLTEPEAIPKEERSMNAEDVIKERAKTHGDFTEHARLTQAYKDVFETSSSFEKMTVEEREAVHMILHKLGRIGAGDPHYADHWIDIAGYATLVKQRLPSTFPDTFQWTDQSGANTLVLGDEPIKASIEINPDARSIETLNILACGSDDRRK